MADKMSKGERTELGSLIRKRERVMKADAELRALDMMAEFDRQSAKIYSFDDDDVWKQIAEDAIAVIEEAQKAIAERCVELGIPREFAPTMSIGWSGRGQNASAARRAELRRAAKSKVDAMTAEAVSKIERLSLQAQTEVIANGLESDAAKAFLERMPPLVEMMPQITAEEMQALVDLKRKDRASSGLPYHLEYHSAGED